MNGMKTKKIPPQTLKILDRLNDYLLSARYDWTTYLTLYSDTETREILKRTAPPFFGSLQFQMRSSVVLSLARLFDPSTPVQENLTLYTLLNAVKTYADQDVIDTIEQMINEVRIEAEPIRQERHKRIAHLDIKLAFNKHQLWDVQEQQITALLERIEWIMDQAETKLRGGTYYRHVSSDMAKAHVAQLVEKLRDSES